MNHRLPRTGALGVAALLTLSACGGGDDATATTSEGAGALEGESFVVGAKDFSEQNILAEMTAMLLAANGADAEAKEVKGSVNTRTALESGELDLYWEYTGTAWITYLGETDPLGDPQEQYDAVVAADAEKNGIAWLERAEFNNTYALAVPTETAEELGVSALSDLAGLDASDLTICVESEFAAREDGLPGLLAAYGLDVPTDNIKLLDTGVIYTETDKGETCTFGEVFATDGRIKALDLLVLEDDEKFFPVYQGAVTLKQETLDANPEIAEVLAPLAERLTTEVMQDLNAQVDVDGEDPEDVAEAWLQDEGLL